MYRPPDYSNLLAFFKELGKYLNQACETCDNFIVMTDFHIDVRQTSPESILQSFQLNSYHKIWCLFY